MQDQEAKLRLLAEQSHQELITVTVELDALRASLEEDRTLLREKEEAAAAMSGRVEAGMAATMRSALRVMFCHARAKGTETGNAWQLGVFPHDGAVYLGQGPGFLPLCLPPEGEVFTSVGLESPEPDSNGAPEEEVEEQDDDDEFDHGEVEAPRAGSHLRQGPTKRKGSPSSKGPASTVTIPPEYLLREAVKRAHTAEMSLQTIIAVKRSTVGDSQERGRAGEVSWAEMARHLKKEGVTEAVLNQLTRGQPEWTSLPEAEATVRAFTNRFLRWRHEAITEHVAGRNAMLAATRDTGKRQRWGEDRLRSKLVADEETLRRDATQECARAYTSHRNEAGVLAEQEVPLQSPKSILESIPNP